DGVYDSKLQQFVPTNRLKELHISQRNPISCPELSSRFPDCFSFLALTTLKKAGVNMTKFDPARAERAKSWVNAPFPFGIEEEYFRVDAQTKVVARDVPRAFFEAANDATQGRISPEFLQPQIEVKSSPQVSMADARSELRELRHIVSGIAAQHGLAIFAAGTHPTAIWGTALQTPKERYDQVMHDLQMIGQR